ncbi:MAG: PDZ domain-containing protein [Elusimicrobia bacterium]|nr:PDZ domain-containing protein [Elusimicrobiota bacterium]
MYYRRTVRHSPAPPTAAIAQAAPPEECFAEKATKLLYALGFVVAVLLALGMHRFCRLLADRPAAGGWREAAAWSMALRPCPYCSGMLDHRGRCNVPGCPLYAPGAGAFAAAARGLLIPELALEAVPVPDGPGVMAGTVYAGGPAEAGGLQSLDRILRFNGRRVRSLAQFQRIVAQARPETMVKILIERGGAPAQALIRVGEGEFRPPAKPVAWGYCPVR